MKYRKTFFSAACIFLSVCFISCGPDEVPNEISGRKFVSPAKNLDNKINILIYYDMEGLSGQNSIRSIDFGNEEYFAARKWLTDDVNAVVEGLFTGGADSVEIVDAHGSFNPEPDILLDKMDPRARMLYKDKPFRPYVDLVGEGKYDAVALVGMHSKTGGGGFGAHTINFGMDWILNDMSINESEIFAYSWGRVSVPVIFASGDDTLADQLSWMDWLECVIVKKALGADNAELRPFEEVHCEMREAAERAVRNMALSKAVVLTEPIKAQLKAVFPADLSLFENIPGIDYRNRTVTFSALNFIAAYDGMRGLMSAAQTGYFQLLFSSLFRSESGMKVFSGFKEELFAIWMDVESGRWKPQSESMVPSGPPKKYFGNR